MCLIFAYNEHLFLMCLSYIYQVCVLNIFPLKDMQDGQANNY